jgi:hypothetical protein
MGRGEIPGSYQNGHCLRSTGKWKHAGFHVGPHTDTCKVQKGVFSILPVDWDP